MSSPILSPDLSLADASDTSTFEDFLPPENTFLADSFWPIFHQSTYVQASTTLRGPEPGDLIEVDVLNTNLSGPSPWLTFSEAYDDGTRVIWGATSTHVFKAIANEDSFDVIDSYRIDFNRFSFHWNLLILEDNKVIVADRGKNTYYQFADADPSDWSSEIILEDAFEIPDSIPGSAGHFSVSYDGWIIFVTDDGYIGAFNTADFTQFTSLQLPRSDSETNFHNTYAIDEEGGIYIATTDRMFRVNWRDTEFSLAWDIPYDFRGPGCEGINRTLAQEFLAVANGEPCTGSGTTPSLMGFDGQDELVLVSDGHIPNNMVAFWRDEIPDDWQGLPGYDRRVAAVVPLPYSTPEGEGGTAENSPVVWGYDIAIAQYNGFRPGPNPVPGVQKLTWNPETRTLDLAWATDEVNFNNVMTYSAPSNLVYGTGQREGTFYFWALDWDTGDVALEVLLGEGDDYLDQGNQVVIDEDGNVFYSSSTGIVRLQVDSPTDGLLTPVDDLLEITELGNSKALNLAVELSQVAPTGELKIYITDADGANRTQIDSISILEDGLHPSYSPSLNLTNITMGTYLQFELVEGDTTSIASLTTREDGAVTLVFEGGTQLVAELQDTEPAADLVIGDAEGFDLTGFSGQVQATFSVYQEANFADNTVVFFTMEGVGGEVRDPLTGSLLLPGDAGYQAAALASQLDVELSSANDQVKVFDATLAGDVYLGVLLKVTDAGPDEQYYLGHASANSDRVDHVKRLGDNAIGFEDLANGGDFDYNDIVIQASFV